MNSTTSDVVNKKFNIYIEVQKEYPGFPTDVLLDMFRLIKKYKKFNLPNLTNKFELKTNFVSKMGVIRVLDELKLLSKQDWKRIEDAIPEMNAELSKRYNKKSLKNDLYQYQTDTEFFGHVSGIKRGTITYICIDHLKLYDTGENIGPTINHISLQKLLPIEIREGDFVVFTAKSYRYRSSEGTRKFGLRLVEDDAIRVISLKEAKQWYNEKKEDARNFEIQSNYSHYGKPKTYYKITG